MEASEHSVEAAEHSGEASVQAGEASEHSDGASEHSVAEASQHPVDFLEEILRWLLVKSLELPFLLI